MGSQKWPGVLQCDDANEKVNSFHETLIHILDNKLPTKTVKMTSLDKPWYSPALKLMNKDKQNKFYKNGNTPRYKQLKTKFRNAKRKASKTFYPKFIQELKKTNPEQYFRMAKQVGASHDQRQSEIKIECLEMLSGQQQKFKTKRKQKAHYQLTYQITCAKKLQYF